VAGGNGTVEAENVLVHAYIPVELKYMIQRYQNIRKLPTFSAAFRELIETHPSIAQVLAQLYTAASQIPERK
jgi:hypothetical protein